MAEKTCTAYSLRVMVLGMLSAVLIMLIPLLYASVYTDLFQSTLHLPPTEITGFLYKNRRIIQFKPSATKSKYDLVKQQNSTTVPRLVLQKPTAHFQPITSSHSELEMQKHETHTSRLIFDNSTSDFWVPSRALSEGLKLDLDSNLPKVNYVGNKTMLIVIENHPRYQFWKSFNSNTMKTCKYSNCLISKTKSDIPNADAVLFDAGNLPPKVPHRISGQPWVIFRWESQVHTPNKMGQPEWRGVFNWTMTFTIDSDLFAPVGMFVPTAKSSSYQHLLDVVQKKSRTAAWFVSRCKTSSGRMEYVKRLQKVIDVDIFGRCGTQSCPKGNSECVQKLLRTYKFYLSFENSLCKDYITEKLYKTFSVPCVPVVRGAADYKHLVPRGTYINAADFRSPEDLGRYLKNLSDDIPAYMEIVMRKEQYRAWNSTVGKQMAFCDLCYRLNHPSVKRNRHNDTGEWLRGKCHAPKDLEPIHDM